MTLRSPATAAVSGTAEPVLELAGVTKAYRGTPPVRALDGVNLSVHAGEFVWRGSDTVVDAPFFASPSDRALSAL